MAEIRILDSRDPGFLAGLDGLLAWESVSDGAVNQRVNQILADVRAQGDAALLDYTRRFDG